MSSQLTFTVRFPTGHSVTVRVSPNDPVSRIVEEACAKRKGDHNPMGFSVGKQGPAGRLSLVDKSLIIRHANLPNRYNANYIHAMTEFIPYVGSWQTYVHKNTPIESITIAGRP